MSSQPLAGVNASSQNLIDLLVQRGARRPNSPALTAPAEMPVTLSDARPLRQLTVALASAGVRYGRWKSRLDLARVMRGDGDLDLLVHPEDRDVFLRIAHGAGEMHLRLAGLQPEVDRVRLFRIAQTKHRAADEMAGQRLALVGSLGIDEELRRAGVEPGDEARAFRGVRLGDGRRPVTLDDSLRTTA